MPWTVIVLCFVMTVYCLVETVLLTIEKDPVSAVFEGSKALVFTFAGYQIASLI